MNDTPSDGTRADETTTDETTASDVHGSDPTENVAADAVERGTVETNGIETYYVRRGTGRPIVFVHGMAMNAEEWTPQMRALAGEYQTVAYDVRGHGRTGGSDVDTYDMPLYADDLHALLDALDVTDPIVCGLSMGGCIAQAYAVRYPDDVAGLVLADTFTTAPLPLAGRLVFANLRALAALDRVVRYTTLNRLQTRIGNRLAPGIAGNRDDIQAVMAATPTIPHREFAKIARSVAAFPKSDLDPAAITAPTLVVHGEHVPGVIRTMHERLLAALANAPTDSLVVPDAGHASNLDNPEFFTDAVRQFASTVDARRD